MHHPINWRLLLRELHYKSPQCEGASVMAKSWTCGMTALWGGYVVAYPAALHVSELGQLLLKHASALTWGWGALGLGSVGLTRIVIRARSSIWGVGCYFAMAAFWLSIWIFVLRLPLPPPVGVAMSTGVAGLALWALCTSFYRRESD